MTRQYIIILLAAFVALSGCEEVTYDPVLQLGDVPTLAVPASGTTFVVTEENLDETMATFSWSEADFGFQAGVDYTVQMDVAGNGFADPADLGPTVNQTSLAVVHRRVNSALIARGLPSGTAHELEVRVVASVSEEVEPLISPVLAITVTPFEQAIEYPKLYVPGAHQGWDPATAPNIYSVPGNGQYDGYVHFADPNTEFKVTEGPNWDVNYGDTGADGTLDQNGDNILANEAGVYRLQVNINDLSFSNTRTAWGIIGSATPTGWDSDTDMTYDPATKVFSVTMDLVAGEIKFRANDDWAINLGDVGGDSAMEYDGDNIIVDEAGNYTIELVLSDAIYTYVLTKN